MDELTADGFEFKKASTKGLYPWKNWDNTGKRFVYIEGMCTLKAKVIADESVDEEKLIKWVKEKQGTCTSFEAGDAEEFELQEKTEPKEGEEEAAAKVVHYPVFTISVQSPNQGVHRRILHELKTGSMVAKKFPEGEAKEVCEVLDSEEGDVIDRKTGVVIPAAEVESALKAETPGKPLLSLMVTSAAARCLKAAKEMNVDLVAGRYVHIASDVTGPMSRLLFVPCAQLDARRANGTFTLELTTRVSDLVQVPASDLRVVEIPPKNCFKRTVVAVKIPAPPSQVKSAIPLPATYPFLSATRCEIVPDDLWYDCHLHQVVTRAPAVTSLEITSISCFPTPSQMASDLVLLDSVLDELSTLFTEESAFRFRPSAALKQEAAKGKPHPDRTSLLVGALTGVQNTQMEFVKAAIKGVAPTAAPVVRKSTTPSEPPQGVKSPPTPQRPSVASALPASQDDTKKERVRPRDDTVLPNKRTKPDDAPQTEDVGRPTPAGRPYKGAHKIPGCGVTVKPLFDAKDHSSVQALTSAKVYLCALFREAKLAKRGRISIMETVAENGRNTSFDISCGGETLGRSYGLLIKRSSLFLEALKHACNRLPAERNDEDRAESTKMPRVLTYMCQSYGLLTAGTNKAEAKAIAARRLTAAEERKRNPPPDPRDDVRYRREQEMRDLRRRDEEMRMEQERRKKEQSRLAEQRRRDEEARREMEERRRREEIRRRDEAELRKMRELDRKREEVMRQQQLQQQQQAAQLKRRREVDEARIAKKRAEPAMVDAAVLQWYAGKMASLNAIKKPLIEGLTRDALSRQGHAREIMQAWEGRLTALPKTGSPSVSTNRLACWYLLDAIIKARTDDPSNPFRRLIEHRLQYLAANHLPCVFDPTKQEACHQLINTWSGLFPDRLLDIIRASMRNTARR